MRLRQREPGRTLVRSLIAPAPPSSFLGGDSVAGRASALRFRPPRLTSGRSLFPSVSLWCLGSALSAAGSGLLAGTGSGLHAARTGSGQQRWSEGRGKAPRYRGADLPESVPRVECDPSSPCSLFGGTVLTLRGPRPLGAARSISSGENVGCSSEGPHYAASR